MEITLGPTQYEIIQSGFEYKLVFHCPHCNKEWWTRDYSWCLDTFPTETILHCHSEIGGCGETSKITFEGV